MRDQSLISQITRELEALRGKRVALITHAGGDPDGIASCMVLSRLVKEVFSSADSLIVIPERVSDHSERFCSVLGIGFTTEAPKNVDACVASDVGSPSQLGPLSDLIHRGNLIVIDHHVRSEWDAPDVKVFSSISYKATSEIVLDLAIATDFRLSEREATALFAGIYYDTVRLFLADSEVLSKLGRLGEYMASPKDLLPHIETPIDISERIARLKGAKRAEIFRADDMIIAVTRVSAFRPSVARSLLTLGAHVGIATHEEEGEIDVTFRASQDVLTKYNINLLTDVFNELAAKVGGRSGGHATAGRAQFRGNSDKVIELCLNKIATKLGTVLKRVEE
ncbi:MAG: DHH family phosphoesterase [Aigarchaeota archaeon]|nr:DHH family phosphoesterase [Aigarchaeota archaeon]MDW8092431.1 DHH family phosphoesterase [Nitrososphaerota archaeon]